MKLYTKTGDTGHTSLYGGGRVPKYSKVFNAVGEIDELSSRIGMACAYSQTNFLITKKLRKIQRNLQDINTIIATIDKDGKKIPDFNEDKVNELELSIDECESFNDPLTKFILPGVNPLDAQLQLCRTQTRKTERLLFEINNTDVVVTFTKKKEIHELKLPVEINSSIMKYFNRLSDYFFTLSRYACKSAGDKDCFLDDY